MPTKYRDSDPLLGGVLYAGGSYSEGGSYMLVDTVTDADRLIMCFERSCR
jgi:hypothetical protein